MGEIALRWASSLLPPGLSDLPPRRSYNKGLAEHQYQEPDNVARKTQPSGDVEPV